MADETDSGGRPIIVGGRVFVKDKNLEGIVKFVGTTEFAPGKWIGIQLGVPKGKNNGSVHGKSYFTCPELCGLFVRQNQVLMLDEVPEATPTHSFIPKPESRIPTPSTSKHGQRTSPGQHRKLHNITGDAAAATPTGSKPHVQSTVSQPKSQPTLLTKEPTKEVVRLCYKASLLHLLEIDSLKSPMVLAFNSLVRFILTPL